MKHLHVGHVLEVHVIEPHLPAHVGKLDRVGRVDDLRLRIQHLEDALSARHRPLQLRVLEHEVADRVEETLHVQGERDHDADAETSVNYPQPADNDDQSGGRSHQEFHQRHDGGGEPPRLHVGAPVVGVHLVEAADVLLLPRQALDDADAGDVLLQVGVDHGYRLSCADEGAAGAALPYRHRQHQDGHHREGDQGHLHILIEQEEDDQPQPGEVRQDR